MGVPLDWLRGRSPVLPLRVFKARWGHREVLCRAKSNTMLTLRWTAAHPHRGHWIGRVPQLAPSRRRAPDL